ncbi:MAG: hypothetical protein ABIJ09_13005 [Pseudomonadota bacterium]
MTRPSTRYALTKAERSVLQPLERACERGGWSLDLGLGGPTGTLEGEPLEEGDLFGVVNVPRDLAACAELELKALRARGELVHRVHVGETWDPFLAPLEVQHIALEAMETLSTHGVDLYLHTRAMLSRTVIERLAAIQDRVRVILPFVSMRPDISAVWEPGAATPGERLRCARALTSRGVRVAGRADPLLPLINDTQADIEEFCTAFSGTGMHRAAAAYLQLTPERARAMSRVLSRMHRDVLKGCFVGRSWQQDEAGRSFKVLEPALRERGLRRFLEVAQKLGLAASVCGCREGDVLAGTCHDRMVGTPSRRMRPADKVQDVAGQLDFFGKKALA